jgi:hypothetical protein
MADPNHSVIARVFHDAVNQPVSSRREFLDRACEGDSTIRAKVEELLAALEMTDDFLAPPPGVLADRPGAPPADETVPDAVAPRPMTNPPALTSAATSSSSRSAKAASARSSWPNRTTPSVAASP